MIVLVGKSASGKTEVAKVLVKNYGYEKLVTYTTREKRIKEVDGIDYNFVSKDEFLKLKEEGFFFETALYNDNFYGTAIKDIKNNKVVILEPQGLKKYAKLKNVVSFYLDSSRELREKRMTERGDDPILIKKRIEGDDDAFNSSNLEDINFVLESNTQTIDFLAQEVDEIYKNLI